MMHRTAGVVASRFNSELEDGAVVAPVVDTLMYLLIFLATAFPTTTESSDQFTHSSF